MLSQTLPRLASQLIVNKKSSRNNLLQEPFPMQNHRIESRVYETK